MSKEQIQRYEALLEICREANCTQQFASEAISGETLQKVLEAARWSISEENTQPWQLVVVQNEKTRKDLREVYIASDLDYMFWMEQQRTFDMRAKSFRLSGEPKNVLEKLKQDQQWDKAPVILALLGDGRKHWGTPMGNHTFSYRKNQFTDALTTTAVMIHLSAAALGLSSQWIDIHIQQPYKRLLHIPDIYFVHSFIAIGYSKGKGRCEKREPLEELVHYEQFDLHKMLSNEEIINKLKK